MPTREPKEPTIYTLEIMRVLDRAHLLDDLTEGQRECLSLRLRGYTLRDIAKIRHVSEVTAGRVTKAAKGKMAKAYFQFQSVVKVLDEPPP